ncbi:SRPBCC domain-containing protein [Sideroxydans lithotrophicus]|uniref:Activator of Hsp90 ATPase 1 family protein n=1 Tax=Sideroxydans lithotrophicus (strain ES-1) TaxID=580332 RepID=D5CLV8_SIDLE|nr:SRPBCC domain-containing protein [Sideroxydans lithotrophicus]ADE12553.1 Activator of Hsp90 ATPase 1 family protein [Sideroxydans lithotrophicus ES-1]
MNQANNNELVITRTFDAPRALVWQAWTDPKHIKRWWGPAGFNNETCVSDLRVGGRFHLEMRAPDGNMYPCIGTFREIVEAERIVYEGEATDGHPCGAGIPPRATVTVSFAEQDGKTHLTLHTRFASAERKQAAADARFVVSWKEALERLAEDIGR